MIYKEIEADGDFYLSPFGADETRRLITVRHTTVVNIDSNVDGATVTAGYEDYEGNFNAYPEGDISTSGGKEVIHGIGTKLMVRVSGITANSVHVAYSSS